MSAFFDDLERELRRATVRRAAAHRAARVSLLRRAPVAAVLLIVVSVAAAFVALRPQGTAAPGRAVDWPGLPVRTPPPPGWPLVSDEPAGAQLQGVLGVLRRPQEAGDRDAGVVGAAGGILPQGAAKHRAFGYPDGRVLLPSVRRAAEGEWGAVWLVPFRPATTGPDGGALAPAERGERFVVTLQVGPAAGRAGGAVAASVAPPAPTLAQVGYVAVGSNGRRSVTAVVVPDGVASVGFRFTDRSRARSSQRILQEAARVVPVVGNVAALGYRTSRRSGYPSELAWYDAERRLIMRYRPSPPPP